MYNKLLTIIYVFLYFSACSEEPVSRNIRTDSAFGGLNAKASKPETYQGSKKNSTNVTVPDVLVVRSQKNKGQFQLTIPHPDKRDAALLLNQNLDFRLDDSTSSSKHLKAICQKNKGGSSRLLGDTLRVDLEIKDKSNKMVSESITFEFTCSSEALLSISNLSATSVY